MRTILIIGAGQAGLQLTVPGPDGGQGLHWAARLDAPAQSVDQRVKIPGWMRAFEQRSGKLLILDASAEDLEEYATGNDLVLAAAGRGPIASLFERDGKVAVRQAAAGT